MFASLAVMILFPNLGYSAGYSTGLGGDDGSAWRGAFIQKNALGSAASFGAIFSWYSYITRTNSRFLSAATFLACIFLLAMSRSVTATMATMAAGLAAVIAWAIQSQERAPVFRSFALVALCILVMFLMVLPLTDFSPNHLPGLAGRSGTLTGRTDIWRAVAAEIRDRPLTGHGYAFWDIPSVARRNIWLSVGWTPEDAHDDWMETLLQIGLVGVLITTFIWFSAFRRSIWLIFMRHKNGTLLYFTILVSYFFQGLTETVSLPPGTGLLFWWVTSYIYIASNNRERSAAKMSTAIGGVGTGIDQPALQPAARTL
jgi:O-antigen ligase